jgi:putative transposase
LPSLDDHRETPPRLVKALELRPSAVRVKRVCRLLDDAEADLLAFYSFPGEHWPKLKSTNPSRASTRSSAGDLTLSASFRNDPAAIRIAGALLIERNDEWLVCRR